MRFGGKVAMVREKKDKPGIIVGHLYVCDSCGARVVVQHKDGKNKT